MTFLLSFVLFMLLIELTHGVKKSLIAVPRRKQQTSLFNNGFVNKIFRSVKSNFCSELEASVLKLTTPSNVAVSPKLLNQLTTATSESLSVGDPEEGIEFTMLLLSKLSRKLSETDVYTKIKSIFVIHNALHKLRGKSQRHFVNAVVALQEEIDTRSDGLPFFSSESVSSSSSIASNVAEVEAVEVAALYYHYVFDLVSLMQQDIIALVPSAGGASNSKKTANSRKTLKELVSLRDRAVLLVDSCRGAGGPLCQQCASAVEEDLASIRKQIAAVQMDIQQELAEKEAARCATEAATAANSSNTASLAPACSPDTHTPQPAASSESDTGKAPAKPCRSAQSSNLTSVSAAPTASAAAAAAAPSHSTSSVPTPSKPASSSTAGSKPATKPVQPAAAKKDKDNSSNPR